MITKSPLFLLSIKTLFLCTLLILMTASVSGQEVVAKLPKDTLTVGVAGSAPFVFDDLEKGIAVKIWNQIAAKNKWNYKFVSFDNVSNALEDINNGNLDVVVGPISITASRLDNMKFSQPFYNSSISIMSLNKELTLWQKIKPFFSFQLLIAVFIFLIILAFVGALLWLAERKASPDQFPSEPLNGIGTGMWLAIVTMSTTGYGDKAPITVFGRIIAGVWMIISLISATSMVAGIASTLTLSSLGKTTITHIEQLTNLKTVTITGSPAEEFLKNSSIKTVTVDTIEEAIEKLKSNMVQAVIYDRPQLLYYLKNNDDDELFISKAEYYKQGYGFAMPLNSNLSYAINRSLLELAENQEKDQIIHFYIQKDE